MADFNFIKGDSGFNQWLENGFEAAAQSYSQQLAESGSSEANLKHAFIKDILDGEFNDVTLTQSQSRYLISLVKDGSINIKNGKLTVVSDNTKSSFDIKQAVNDFFTACGRKYASGSAGQYFADKFMDTGTDVEALEKVLRDVPKENFSDFVTLIHSDFRSRGKSLEALLVEEVSGRTLGHLQGIVDVKSGKTVSSTHRAVATGEMSREVLIKQVAYVNTLKAQFLSATKHTEYGVWDHLRDSIDTTSFDQALAALNQLDTRNASASTIQKALQKVMDEYAILKAEESQSAQQALSSFETAETASYTTIGAVATVYTGGLASGVAAGGGSVFGALATGGLTGTTATGMLAGIAAGTTAETAVRQTTRYAVKEEKNSGKNGDTFYSKLKEDAHQSLENAAMTSLSMGSSAVAGRLASGAMARSVITSELSGAANAALKADENYGLEDVGLMAVSGVIGAKVSGLPAEATREFAEGVAEAHVERKSNQGVTIEGNISAIGGAFVEIGSGGHGGQHVNHSTDTSTNTQPSNSSFPVNTGVRAGLRVRTGVRAGSVGGGGSSDGNSPKDTTNIGPKKVSIRLAATNSEALVEANENLTYSLLTLFTGEDLRRLTLRIKNGSEIANKFPDMAASDFDKASVLIYALLEANALNDDFWRLLCQVRPNSVVKIKEMRNQWNASLGIAPSELVLPTIAAPSSQNQNLPPNIVTDTVSGARMPLGKEIRRESLKHNDQVIIIGYFALADGRRSEVKQCVKVTYKEEGFIFKTAYFEFSHNGKIVKLPVDNIFRSGTGIKIYCG